MVLDADTNEYLPTWVHTEVSHISLALCVLGFYLVTVNQLSFYLKSRLFMSNALLALCIGIGERAPIYDTVCATMSLRRYSATAVGPIGLDWVSPWQWTNFDDEARYNLTFQITRLVIGIRKFLATHLFFSFSLTRLLAGRGHVCRDRVAGGVSQEGSSLALHPPPPDHDHRLVRLGRLRPPLCKRFDVLGGAGDLGLHHSDGSDPRQHECVPFSRESRRNHFQKV